MADVDTGTELAGGAPCCRQLHHFECPDTAVQRWQRAVPVEIVIQDAVTSTLRALVDGFVVGFVFGGLCTALAIRWVTAR